MRLPVLFLLAMLHYDFMIPASLCVRCKGRLWCKLPSCPILEKFQVRKESVAAVKDKRFEGSSPPSVFVSWRNYPSVNIAPLSPPVVSEKNAVMDDPEQWFGLSQEKIVSFRSQLIQSRKSVKVSAAANPSYDLVDVQELALSLQPVEAKFELFDQPKQHLSFHEGTAPLGPVAGLKKMKLEENPSIPTKVDYLVSDTAVKSTTAVQELFEKGFPVHYLSKILSAGTLGIKNNRKLVPTRWSITAIDDSVSKFLVDESVKEQSVLDGFELFSSSFAGNSFFVLLLPRVWSFEMMECWLPGSPWTLEDPSAQQQNQFNIIDDFEFFEGRSSYADNITGAYYAARLAVAEHLVRRKKQAAALIFREIGNEYVSPLGVWVIRETVRNALQKKPLQFSDLDLALQYLQFRLKVPLELYKKTSKLLDAVKHQKRISDWF